MKQMASQSRRRSNSNSRQATSALSAILNTSILLVPAFLIILPL